MIVYPLSSKGKQKGFEQFTVSISKDTSQTISLPSAITRIEIEQPGGWVPIVQGQNNFIGFKVYYTPSSLVIGSSQNVSVNVKVYYTPS